MFIRKAILTMLLAIAGIICIGCTFNSSSASSKMDNSNVDALTQNMLLESAQTTIARLQNTSTTITTKISKARIKTNSGSTINTKTEGCTETTTIAATTIAATTSTTTQSTILIKKTVGKNAEKTESVSIVETTANDISTDEIITEDFQQEPQNENNQVTHEEKRNETSQEKSIKENKVESKKNETIKAENAEDTSENSYEQTEESTEYTPEEPTEEPTQMPVEEQVEVQLNDAIIIGDNVIEIAYGPADQDNIDKYDVVQDTEYWSDDTSKYLFGHNYRSFSCLKRVNVGETITLINDGCSCDYVVTRSEKGKLTSDNMDIKSCVDDTRLISGDFEHDNIRLITCVDVFSPTYRWVVIAEKIE